MSNPKPQPLWAIVEGIRREADIYESHNLKLPSMPSVTEREGKVRGMRLCADRLADALRAWAEQIRAGIEKRKTEVNPLGPLHAVGTNQAAHDILEHILGVPPKEPAQKEGQ